MDNSPQSIEAALYEKCKWGSKAVVGQEQCAFAVNDEIFHNMVVLFVMPPI